MWAGKGKTVIVREWQECWIWEPVSGCEISNLV